MSIVEDAHDAIKVGVERKEYRHDDATECGIWADFTK